MKSIDLLTKDQTNSLARELDDDAPFVREECGDTMWDDELLNAPAPPTRLSLSGPDPESRIDRNQVDGNKSDADR